MIRLKTGIEINKFQVNLSWKVNLHRTYSYVLTNRILNNLNDKVGTGIEINKFQW